MQSRSRSDSGRLPAGPGSLCAAAVLLLASVAAAQQETTQERVANTRTVLEQWVRTRQLISKERGDWTLGRELLDERVDLVRQEIESLREKIADAEKSLTEADKKRTDLIADNERLKEASKVLEDIVAGLEESTRRLVARLPDPIAQRVRPLSQQIPEDPAATELSLGLRFQNVIGVLTMANKFNGEITVTSEVRELPNGSTVEVTALYVGLGQGYYVTAKGDAAGIGLPAESGWRWTPANEAAEAIASAVAIVQGEQAATFVPLPVEIR